MSAIYTNEKWNQLPLGDKKIKICTFAPEFQIHSAMTETKKAFKDWDVSDFKDFTDMGGMQKFEETRSHRPFFGFNKHPKGTPSRPT